MNHSWRKKNSFEEIKNYFSNFQSKCLCCDYTIHRLSWESSQIENMGRGGEEWHIGKKRKCAIDRCTGDPSSRFSYVLWLQNCFQTENRMKTCKRRPGFYKISFPLKLYFSKIFRIIQKIIRSESLYWKTLKHDIFYKTDMWGDMAS